MSATLLKSADRTGRLQAPEITRAGGPVRALVIFPPARRSVRAMYTFHNEDEYATLGHKPPLGPLYVASYAKKNSPHDVRILDCQVLNLSDDAIREEIRAFAPHVVGVTAWTDFWYDAWRCIQLVKEVDPSIHVTVGGPHTGIYPRETLEHSDCDSVIQGDGELPFLWLLNGYSNGRIPEDLPGLHLRGAAAKPCEDAFYIHKTLDDLGIPDRTLLPYTLYRSVLTTSDLVTTMITSRGCPFKCTFCKLNFQKTLCRSAEDVVNEFEYIAGLGVKEIEIYDDTFTWSKKRLVEICRGIVERGIKVDWAIRDRVSSPTPETMEWLARAGCRRIHFGIESGSNDTLLRIKKAINKEQAVDAVKLAKKHGIEVLTYFMLGLPGETAADMQETADFARSLNPDFTTFSVTVPYAGTEMYEDALKAGIIPHDYWLDYARKPTPNFVIPWFWEEHCGKEELLRIRDAATRSFYFRPRYMLRQLTRVRSRTELAKKARMALGLFRVSVLGKGRSIYEKVGAGAAGFANNAANPVSVRS